MKQVLVVGMVCSLLMMPVLVRAQTYSDNSGQDWGQWYRRGSNEMQQKINTLSDTPVMFVPIPILFGVTQNTIAPNFGDPRSGGRKHEGEDMMATKGTPIISPTQAVVLRTGVGPSEGNYVYTANPGGETFVYMHLDRIGEGVTSGTFLEKGALIGYVGNTGNASGGAAHLHFEIHNNSGTPIDPYPRLAIEFSLADKINALSGILNQTSDSVALSNFLVNNFRSTLNLALMQNIALPPSITSAMGTASSGSVSSSNSIPVGDFSVGSSGTSVSGLQKYLIQANIGPAAAKLKAAGATGYFGELTRVALYEFQSILGITPTNGYYGVETRAYINAHPIGVVVPAPTPSVQPSPSTSANTPRNLSRNMTGEDVRVLQKLLNARGFIIAATGAGSPGNETTYFGPATEAAVKKFQALYGIVPASGVVGLSTRVELGSL